MAANGGAPGNLMDLMDHTPAQSGKKAEKSSKKGASSSGLPVDGVPPQASKAQAPPADAKKKKPISYGQLAKSVIELAASGDQKTTQKQLVSSIFPKLSVFSTVDIQLVPAFLKLLQVEDRATLRYVFYYLGRILGEVGTSKSAPQTPGTAGPNWEALGGSSTPTAGDKTELINQVVNKLAEEAGKKDPASHGRRVAALSALAHAPPFLEGAMRKLAQAAFEMLAQVNDGSKLKRAKRGIFGRSSIDKETALRANLQYAALAALRRLPADPGNQQLLNYSAQGVGAADPVAARHALAILCTLAIANPTGVASALSKMSKDGSISLGEQVQCPDVFARVYLARLSSILLFAPSLARPDLQSQFGALLFKLILDPSTKVSLEAINCMVGSINGEGSPDARAHAWMLLQKASMVVENGGEEPKPKKGAAAAAPTVKTVEPVLSVAAQRLEYILRSESRPALHAACRAVAEWGRARAYAGNYADEPAAPAEKVEVPADTGLFADLDFSTPEEIAEREAAKAKGPEASRNLLDGKRLTRSQLGAVLAPLMEAVRSTVACECVYTRCAALKAMIWMQTETDSAEELQSTIAGELADSFWPASLLNELLLQIHSRFKATPELAGTLLKITNSWATLVPHKVDVDVLQTLWKSCLVGCGPPGKHIALEAVGNVLDLPPPKPPGLAKPSRTPAEQAAAAAASDPKGATALQRLVQAAVWFLGENANYAASEYAWEPQSAAGQMLMMMEGEKMVMAAGVRNPTLAAALARLQRCAVASSWEVRVVAAQAIITVALRSGEPYRLQCYEFLTSLLRGEKLKHKLQEQQGVASSGEDEGGSGSGLANVVAPMLRMLDEIYTAQDQFVRELRQHENSKEEWTEPQLESLFNTHDTLLRLVSLFCFVPRSKYLPLGPTSADLIEQYKLAHNIVTTSTPVTPNDAAVTTGIANLTVSGPGMYMDMQPSPAPAENGGPTPADDPWAGTPPGMDLVNDFLGGAVPKVIGSLGDEKGPPPGEPDAPVNYDDLWASTMLEEQEEARGGAVSDSDDDASSVISSTSDASSMQTSGGIFERPGSFKVQTFSPLGFASPSREGGASTSSPFSGSITNESPRVFRRSLDWSTSASSPTAARGGNAHFDSVSASQSRPSHTRGLSTLSEASAGGSGKTVFGQNGEPPRMGKAIYDFEAGGADEVDLKVGDVVQIQYEVEGWYHVTKVDAYGRPSGLAPVLYIEVSQ